MIKSGTVSGVNDLTELYWYNDAGERVVKRTFTDRPGDIEYVNQFSSFAMTDGISGKLMTKNIYLGNDRVASKVVPIGTLIPAVSEDVYYYHKDHLGSSSYLTDKDANIDEHVEYTPWGESWLEAKSEDMLGNSLNYMFTGKEQDMTRLYYFGARYYDPQTSVWMSPDPILKQYLDGKPNDGVFDSINLGLFSYGALNPLKYVDPNGKHNEDEIDKNRRAELTEQYRGSNEGRQELWGNMKSNHPGDEAVFSTDVFENQCAISFSEALEKSGFDFSNFTGATTTKDFPELGDKTPNVLRAQEMADYMEKNQDAFGVLSKGVSKDDIKGKEGYIFIQNGWGSTDHIDVIDKEGNLSKGSPDYLDRGTIWFWEIKAPAPSEGGQ